VNGVVFSPSGRYVAGSYSTVPFEQPPGGAPSAEEDFRAGIYVWDATTGKAVHRLDTEGGETSSLRFAPGEAEVVGVLEDRVVVWDLASGRERSTVAPKVPGGTPTTPPRPAGGPADGPVDGVDGGDGGDSESFWGVLWSPDGSILATALGQRIQLWDASTGRQVGADLVHPARVADLSFDATGDRLVSLSEDGNIVIWNVRTRKAIRSLDSRLSATWVRFAGSNRLTVLGQRGIPSVVWLDGKELLDVANSRATRQLTPDECRHAVADEQICSSD
jgi:WD40 repeat protein